MLDSTDFRLRARDEVSKTQVRALIQKVTDNRTLTAAYHNDNVHAKKKKSWYIDLRVPRSVDD